MMKQNNTGLFVGIVVAVAVAVIAVVAVGSHKSSNSPSSSYGSTTKSSTSTSGAVAATDVKIQNYMFSPMVIKVKVGATVTWTNQDSVHHSVVADTISADAPNGPLIGQGETYKFTFNKAGTYTFHCGAHPDMHGTVVVS
jgi:amicyanin